MMLGPRQRVRCGSQLCLHWADPIGRIGQSKRAPALLVTVVGVLVGIAACAPAPVAETFRMTGQHRIRSVSHWQLLAQDTAKGIPPSVLEGAVYVRQTAVRSPFSEGFETYLVGALTNDCLALKRQCDVSQGPQGPEFVGAPLEPRRVYIEYGVQRLEHSKANVGSPTPGVFTLLGTGVWLGHQAAKHWSGNSDYAAAIPVGMLLDVLAGSITAPTHTEVIVSVVAFDKDGIVAYRKDSSYYVDDADAADYSSVPLYVAQHGQRTDMKNEHLDFSERQDNATPPYFECDCRDALRLHIWCTQVCSRACCSSSGELGR
jgi:hypothetical protein